MEETFTVVCSPWGSGWRLQHVAPGRRLTRSHTQTRSDEGGGGGNKRVWHPNRRHFFTEQHRCLQAVSQSVTQKWWTRHPSSIALLGLFLEADEEEVARGGEAWGFSFSGQQDASGGRTHSGGHDEDAAVFCGECRVDPEWDKPHVSSVFLWDWEKLDFRSRTWLKLWIFALLLEHFKTNSICFFVKCRCLTVICRFRSYGVISGQQPESISRCQIVDLNQNKWLRFTASLFLRQFICMTWYGGSLCFSVCKGAIGTAGCTHVVSVRLSGKLFCHSLCLLWYQMYF